MDQNGDEIGTLTQNGRLPVEVTAQYPDVFCTSGHDTNAFRMLFMDVHVGATESPGNTFCQLSSGGHWQ